MLSNMLHCARGVKLKNIYSVYLARDVIIDNRWPSKVEIGQGVVISTRARIIAHSFIPKGNSVVGNKEIVLPVQIGNNVFIGAGVIVLPRSKLCDRCYVGAGSIVRGSFPPDSLIVGNPARVARIYKTNE